MKRKKRKVKHKLTFSDSFRKSDLYQLGLEICAKVATWPKDRRESIIFHNSRFKLDK